MTADQSVTCNKPNHAVQRFPSLCTLVHFLPWLTSILPPCRQDPLLRQLGGDESSLLPGPALLPPPYTQVSRAEALLVFNYWVQDPLLQQLVGQPEQDRAQQLLVPPSYAQVSTGRPSVSRLQASCCRILY